MEDTHKKVHRETSLTVTALLLVGAFIGLYISFNFYTLSELYREGHVRLMVEHAVFFCIALLLIYGTVIYLLTRLGRLLREKHAVVTKPDIIDEAFFGSHSASPKLSILIPSYKEEARVIAMTVWSAALLEYPHKNIVLLVDDPVKYSNVSEQSLLEETLMLPQEIEKTLGSMHGKIEKEFIALEERIAKKLDAKAETLHVATVYKDIAEWFGALRENFHHEDHAEYFFAERIYDASIERYEALHQKLVHMHDEGEVLDVAQTTQLYRRALSIFSAKLTSFQRKRFENMSHEPNKAMNLNSCIGLIGKSYSIEDKDGKLFLEQTTKQNPDITFAAADYVITLDADSVLMHDYAKKLLHLMESPSFKKVAVAQTPYNTFPCPFVNLERIAGATTDIQHLIHQGFTYFHASFWVGANALLRYSALEEIKEIDTERGYEIVRYVQDRTVIEDTESTIDLLTKNWEIYNYLENLAYSATPPDFGSLVIQRRRWANGGLIIFPKLLNYFFRGPGAFSRRLTECFVRSHYLLSIAFVNIGLVVMMVYPFAGELHISWLIGIAVIYFAMYSRDLVQLGYRHGDILRVYTLNLLLIPINIGGVLKSLQQMITKKKIPFGRTPKIADRVVAPSLYIFAEVVLVFYLLSGSAVDVLQGRWEHAIFSFVNGVFMFYAVSYFVGWKHIVSDLVGTARDIFVRLKQARLKVQKRLA